MNNKEMETLLKQEGIYKWQIAKKIGIHETTFIRWFREPLTQEQQMQVKSAIADIKQDRQKQQE